jgi:ABC-type uncharacterized transport system fused permease/ATPase subunit
MTEPLSKTSAPAAAADAIASASLFSEIRRTAALYWSSPERKRLLMLAAGVFMVIAVTAHMQVRLNAWNQPFYDALTHKDVPEFIRQLGVFAVLAAILLTLNVAQVWLNQTTRLTLRRSLVHDMLNEWLKPLRAFRLSNAGSIGANPDQRMSADAQHLADLVTDLCAGPSAAATMARGERRVRCTRSRLARADRSALRGSIIRCLPRRCRSGSCFRGILHAQIAPGNRPEWTDVQAR